MARKKGGIVFVWDVEKGKLLHEFEAISPAAFTVIGAFPTGKSIMLAKTTDETPKPVTVFSVRQIESGTELYKVTIGMIVQDMQSFAISPDGKYLGIGSNSPYSSAVTTWDIQTGKLLHQYC
jgi:hypothetical protein